MKRMSPITAHSSSRPSLPPTSCPPISPPMPPSTTGLSRRRSLTETVSPLSHSIGMGTTRCLAIPMGRPEALASLRMSPSYPFQHTNGFRAQRFRCPLLFPTRTDQTCAHAQFAKGKGCVKDPNWEKGGLMRALLDRDGPLYHAVYTRAYLLRAHQQPGQGVRH